MKNILLTLILFGLIFTSCEETESPIYDQNTTDSTQILAYFDQIAANLEVIIDDSGSVDIPIGVSTLSSTDRQVSFSVVEESTTASADMYSLPASVTIPANEYFGTLTITGIDNNVEITPELLVLKLDALDGGIVSTELLEVSIFQICPVDSSFFLGDYFIEQLTPINPDDDVLVFENQVVNISAGSSSTARQFDAVYLEALAIGQPPATVGFGLICNDVIVDSGIGTSLLCVQGEPVITLGPGLIPSNYNPSDDSYFELTLTEYETDGGCGVAPYQVTFALTKQ